MTTASFLKRSFAQKTQNPLGTQGGDAGFMLQNKPSVVLKGWGSYLPEKVVTNDALSKTLDTSHEWILQRTGIAQRHIVAPTQKTSDLAFLAAEKALLKAGLTGGDIDLIILATSTADHTFPATATRVQERLGAKGAAFDINVACSGFVFALAQADAFLKAGLFKCALVIGAETMSRLLDWNDRTTAILFGDGAGAFVLEAVKGDAPQKSSEESSKDAPFSPGFLGHLLQSDGKGYDALFVGGGVGCGQLGVIQMNGREVYKRAVQELWGVTEALLAQQQVVASQIDWVVPHQANRRIIESVLDRLDVPHNKAVMTMDRHANTSSASIPLAFDVACQKGQIKRGQLIAFQGFAAGFAWGASLLRF